MSSGPSGERPGPPVSATAAQQALIELAEAAGTGASLTEVLERVARAATTLVPGSLVHVWLAGDEQRELRLVVMTDLAMPGMSGWQIAQAVKAVRPQVPVVLVTGWGVEVQADELQTHGVDRVMTKPFRFDDVQEVVASFSGTGRPT